MPSSKRPTLKGTTKKVPPKPHSPPAARDVAKKGRKPPRIREDIPWSPSKVVRQKLAPPDTTIDLTKETSPPSSSNQASAAASTLLSLVTVPTSVAAAASTSLYRQLYSAAEDNHDEEEQLYSDDNEDKDNDYDDEDYVGIHKQPIDEDYDDILDMDIDSEEEFRSSFPKNQNSSKLRVKGGDQRPDVSDLSKKEAEEVLEKWRKNRKAFTDKVNQTAVRADHR